MKIRPNLPLWPVQNGAKKIGKLPPVQMISLIEFGAFKTTPILIFVTKTTFQNVSEKLVKKMRTFSILKFARDELKS